MSFGLIFVGLAAIVILCMGFVIYNNLVGLKNQIERAWRNIEILLKQRYDEIPQLIQVIEQYVSYEQKTLQKIREARKAYVTSNSRVEKLQNAHEMSLAIQGVISLGEGYPDLKSNPSFVQLQNRVSELEGHIADRREFFNETATNFNTRVEQIPDVLVARLLGYTRITLYHPKEEEMALPSSKLNAG